MRRWVRESLAKSILEFTIASSDVNWVVFFTISFLNKGNKVSELSIQQLGAIFSGKITNWKEVGGDDAKIRLYGRESSSGTFEFFREHVVNGDFAANVQTLPGTAAIVNAVAKDK